MREILVVHILKLVHNLWTQIIADGESGIEAKDISSAPTNFQKRQKNLLYPSATEKGSNRLLGESFHGESLMKRNVHQELSPSQIGYHPGPADCQGENYSLILHQNYAQENGMDWYISSFWNFSVIVYFITATSLMFSYLLLHAKIYGQCLFYLI